MTDEPSDPPRIVVGVDGSQPPRAALAAAVEEAARTGAEVEVVAGVLLADYWTDLYSVLVPTAGEIRNRVRAGAGEIVASVLAERPGSAPAAGLGGAALGRVRR
jgi:nucleotide-binding universal stress UspA family protein